MGKKFNLREFQTTLSQQLLAAATRDNTGSRLGFQVGDVSWLVSLADTEEVIPVPSSRFIIPSKRETSVKKT